MKSNIKSKWVDALRSGEYVQGRGCLRRAVEDGQDEFCCLGVLVDLAVKDGLDIPAFLDEDQWWYGAVPNNATLSGEVMEWAGLNSENPPVRVDRNEGASVLARENDHHRNFAEIADLIEGQL